MKAARILTIAALGILAVSASAPAQTADAAPGESMAFGQQAASAPTPPLPAAAPMLPMPPIPPDEAVAVVGAELGPGHSIVKGAPLSAQTETEMTQVLSNGTHIDRKSSGAIYRDSQGRMRLEVTHPLMGGPMAVAGVDMAAGHPMIFIMDPVAQAHYVLEPDRKIARQVGPPPAEHMKEMENFHHGEFDDGKSVTTEPLGTQTINGMSATGTRTTRTIPVGEIGNDSPIQIVTERWYSPALQMNIMTKRTDPRVGTTTYQLINISREEPSESLFQVPTDYTVEQIPMHMRHMEHPQQ